MSTFHPCAAIKAFNPPAMTSTERSRLFRQRHPGYHARYNARRRGRPITQADLVSMLRATADNAASQQTVTP